MLEALVDASKELSKKGIGPRRVIVSVSFNSPETSTIEPQDVANAMRKAGVNYWAVVDRRPTRTRRPPRRAARGSRELIMHNITAASGGMRIDRRHRHLARVADEAARRCAALAEHRHLRAPRRRAHGRHDVQAVSKKG